MMDGTRGLYADDIHPRKNGGESIKGDMGGGGSEVKKTRLAGFICLPGLVSQGPLNKKAFRPPAGVPEQLKRAALSKKRCPRRATHDRRCYTPL